MSASEDYILKGIEALGMVGTVCIEILAVVLLVVVWTLPLIINTPGNVRFVLGGPLLILALFSVGFGYLLSALVFYKIGAFRRVRSPFDRSVLRRSIEKLKGKIGAEKVAPH